MLHGEADPVIPYPQALAAQDTLRALGAEVSLDSEPGTGHEISAALLQAACSRLRATLAAAPER